MPYHFPVSFTTFLQPAIPFQRRLSQASDNVSSSTAPPSPSCSSSSDRSDLGPPSPTYSPSSPAPQQQQQQQYLNGHDSLLRCARCLTHLCPTSAIISKGFHGRHGRAYLVAPLTASACAQLAAGTTSGICGGGGDGGTSTSPPAIGGELGSVLPNVTQGAGEWTTLATGRHVVAAIECAVCHVELGWRYVEAKEEDQRYKVGKYILETRRVVKMVNWECEYTSDRWEGVAQQKQKQSLETMDEDESDDDNCSEQIVFDSEDDDECEDLFSGVWSEKLAVKRRKDKLEKIWRDVI